METMTVEPTSGGQEQKPGLSAEISLDKQTATPPPEKGAPQGVHKIETQEESNPEVPKHKVKFKGKEMEIEESAIRKYLGLAPEDPFDPKATINLYQRARLHEDELNSVHREKREVQSIVEMIQNDFEGFLKNVAGVDPYEYARVIAEREAQMAQMDPYQRQMWEREQAIIQREQEYQMQQQQLAEQRHQEEVIKIFEGWKQGVGKAIQKHGLPMNETFLTIASDHIEAQLSKGRKNVNFEEAAEYTVNQFKSINKDIVGKMDGEQLLTYLGDGVVEKVRDALMKKGETKKTAASQPGKVGVTYQTPSAEIPKTKDEYEAFLAERLKQLDGKR